MTAPPPPQIGHCEIYRSPAGKRVMAYYTNWACYGRQHQVKDIPIECVTDINYAFLKLSQNANGYYVPTFSDPWADTDKRFVQPGEGVDPPDSWNDDPNVKHIYGNLGQFWKLKQKGHRFNLGLSIGGWTGSAKFSSAVATHESREAFVDATIAIMDNLPLGLINRVDLDWEHISPPGQNHGDPGNETHPEDGAKFGLLLELFHAKLESRRQRTGCPCELSACVVADPAKMSALPFPYMIRYLDSLNVMTYDFASSVWSPCLAGHHANLLPVTPYATLSVTGAIHHLVSMCGVPPAKLNIGVATYTRAFASCQGLGTPSQGSEGMQSKWGELGVIDYKFVVATPGWVIQHDVQAGQAGYVYDAEKRVLYSTESVTSVSEKSLYVQREGLQGIFVWETSGDELMARSLSLLQQCATNLLRYQ